MRDHIQLLAERFVRSKDEKIAKAITERLGVGWKLEDLATRLECVTLTCAPDLEHFYLDGQLLLTFYPPEFHQDGNVMTVTQRVECLGTGRKTETNG